MKASIRITVVCHYCSDTTSVDVNLEQRFKKGAQPGFSDYLRISQSSLGLELKKVLWIMAHQCLEDQFFCPKCGSEP